MDPPLLWGVVIGVSVAGVVSTLARVYLQIADVADWPFGPTWLAVGWTTCLVVMALGGYW